MPVKIFLTDYCLDFHEKKRGGGKYFQGSGVFHNRAALVAVTNN